MPLTLEIVTAERLVFSDDNVDMVVAPSVEGEVGILPHHAPLLTLLQIGELRVKKGADEQSIVIAGGFLEVLNNRVTILADVAERAEEIDAAAAEDARRRAQDALANRGATADLANAEAAMRLASLRLRVGQRRRRLRQEEG
ncbi:MAG: F0F1 ATP synthase subunit epsilon [Chloroflexota bacterium]|nr:F0F1 ATP synthase subunit epsilon [Chloroflexota bacterium]MDQ5824708.1 F0F1 ATP synthase subunit epsilon [Chloroflexota bacterium]MDQ5864796.1 F0F1 ATP synthase subunit epsilon [Chloroflexota bacterium]